MGEYYVQGVRSFEFTPENHNIDNNNELLKPETHNKEFSLTLDLTKAPIDKPTMTKFFKLLCSGMKPPKHIRKKYHSPKRREIEMYRWIGLNKR